MWFICENGEDQLIIEVDGWDDPRIAMHGQGGKWTSCSGDYKSKEELWEKARILEKPCVVCGHWIISTFVPERRDRMVKKNMCFHCELWNTRLERVKNDKNVMIVLASMYTVTPDTDNKYAFKGFGGKEFKFERLDTPGVIITSHNVWFGGDIPKIWLPKFPDNAIMHHGHIPG